MLEVRNLSVARGGSTVLRDITLAIPAGQIVAVVGRNGAGKTTLLRSILGYLPKAGGSVAWCGRDISALKTHRIIQAGVAFSPEESEVFAALTVEQNLRFPLLTSQSAKDGEQRLEGVLAVFPKLRGYMHRGGAELSGGERKMVSIARAMMLDPDLLLLDEPFEGLSPLVIPHISAGIAAICETGKTVLLAESNARHVPAFVSRVGILERGEFIYLGEMSEAAKREDLQDYMIGLA